MMFVRVQVIVLRRRFFKKKKKKKKKKKRKKITIHHECPCRKEKFHPRGRNFNKGTRLAEGEISLSYIDRLMMYCSSPIFPSFLSEPKKSNNTRKIEFTSVFIGY